MATQYERTLTGRSVNPIGLGCMNLSWAYGDPPPHDEKVRLLNEALDLGYNHLDTANIYGLGKNEELLADAVMHRRDEFLLASKTGIVVDGKRRGIDCSPQAIAQSLDASLARLKTDHIDLFYMHRLDRNTPIADSVGAMARAIEAGKIGAYGVSEWSSAHIREAHDVHPMAAVQTEMSLWTRNVELGVLETTRELGIALVAFSPVARGALGGELKDPQSLAEKDLRRSMPRFDGMNWPENLAMIERSMPWPPKPVSNPLNWRWHGCWHRATMSMRFPAPRASSTCGRTLRRPAWRSKRIFSRGQARSSTSRP